MGISDAGFKSILEASWDQLCFAAYDGFIKHGRGVIVINKVGEELKAIFTYPAEGHILDAQVLNMVNAYDPELEFVAQYLSDNGNARTVRVEVDGENPPHEVWKKFNPFVEEDLENGRQ